MGLIHKTAVAVRLSVMAAVCIMFFSPSFVRGQEQTTPSDQEVRKGDAQSGVSQSGYSLQFLPDEPLYAPYVADPRRVDFGFQVLHFTRVTIPDSGNLSFDLKAGGQFGLVRIHPAGSEDLGWQLSLEGGFNSQFDIDRHWDNIGWDGRYGIVLSTAQSRNLSFRFGYLHDSSHVGDEYEQRTGRRRIGYTREELAAGASWLTDTGFRTYAEYGYARYMGNKDVQKPGRAELGFEWQQGKPVQGRYRGLYAAADFSAMQERDWRVDTSFQTGYRIDTRSKTWRFGVDWYSGRPPIGEFFQYSEQYLGLGMWLDI